MSKIKMKILKTLSIFEDFYKKKDPNINSIFFKKYKILKLITTSKFSSTYEGININTKEKVAIKLEEKNKYNLLEKEAFTLFAIKGYGIINLISFGKNKKYNIMVLPLLGKSLHKFFININRNFCLLDICLIGLQCIERIEWIHKNYIIHRDIKPDNFLFDLKDPRIIYLIDFGLSKKYRSKRTLKHIKNSYVNKVVGTIRYASVNSMKGFEMSRRDDLESFYYMIIFFLLKNLPWQNIKGKTLGEKYLEILEIKREFNIDDYKMIIPNEIIKMFKYVKNLKFDEEPNYFMIKYSFRSILYGMGHSELDTFSWIKDKRIINSKMSPNICLRKSSLKKRVFDKLYENSINSSSVDKNSRRNKINTITKSLFPNYSLNYNKPIMEPNMKAFTLSSNKNNDNNNYDSISTPDTMKLHNKTIDKTTPNKPTGFHKHVLNCLKAGNNNNNIIRKKEKVKIAMNESYSRTNRQKNNISNKSIINTENINKDFIKNNFKNSFDSSKNYNLFNKNIINLHQNISSTNFQKKNFPNIYINSSSNRNQINMDKFLLMKKNNLLNLNKTTNFIVNNTFINNFNNNSISGKKNNNITHTKRKIGRIKQKNEQIERKNLIINKKILRNNNYSINTNE